jgi:ATP-binding protein involved in chromosome partitioning
VSLPSVSLEQEIESRLDRIAFPGFRHSILRYGLVESTRAEGGDVTVTLRPVSTRREVAQAIAERIREALSALPGVRSVEIATAAPVHAEGQSHAHASAAPSQIAIPGVRRVVAVSSAKGGVGKSTVAVNLAVALQRCGAKVALMDSDVYGPSAPMMMGVEARPHSVGKKIAPIERYGVDIMSMGFFLDDSSPVIWRGPMVMGLVRQFLHDVEWGEQDYMIVDMPPGTGDAALTLAQQVPLSGAVIVTTPQDVALADVERGIGMFRQLQVPLLGIVENMSYYVCPDCGEREEIFGSGGGDSLARRFGVELLAKLPLVAEIREGGDAGGPITVTAPDHAVSRQFQALARAIDRALAAPSIPGRGGSS